MFTIFDVYLWMESNVISQIKFQSFIHGWLILKRPENSSGVGTLASYTFGRNFNNQLFCEKKFATKSKHKH